MMTKLRNELALSLALVCVAIAGSSCSLSQATGPVAAGPPDKTWLSPGKVRISNVSPGKIAKGRITVHNSRETETGFAVYYRVPDYVEDGFIAAPAEARDWVDIAEESPVLASKETREIEVVLQLPDEALTPERWEFWVGVRENIEDSVTAELCSRWLITMRGR